MVELATRERLDVRDEGAVKAIADSFEGRSPRELLRWAIELYGDRLAISTSFQAEGMAILDMAWRIEPRVRVITVDTGRLHPETYELMERVRERYDLPIEVYYPDPAALEPFVRENGINPFYRSITNRFRCCDIRKVDPLARALTTVDAWVAGQRRGHSETRRNVRLVEVDQTHEGLIKLNPLAGWNGEEVWDYLRANDVPYPTTRFTTRVTPVSVVRHARGRPSRAKTRAPDAGGGKRIYQRSAGSTFVLIRCRVA
jgi:phosphoadenylyl-sulfate reductase (thioredoxin)